MASAIRLGEQLEIQVIFQVIKYFFAAGENSGFCLED